MQMGHLIDRGDCRKNTCNYRMRLFISLFVNCLRPMVFPMLAIFYTQFTNAAIIDSPGVGRYASMQWENNQAYISYYDEGNSALKFIKCIADCHTSAPAWSSPMIVDQNTGPEAGVAIGKHSSIKVLNGKPIIAYTFISEGSQGHPVQLRLATCTQSCNTPEDWIKVHVNNYGNGGQFSSLALNNDKPVISYYEHQTGDLKIATCTANCQAANATWVHALIDAGGDVGQYSSLQLRNGKPIVSYYDVTNNQLKIAFCEANCQTSSPRWKKHVVATGGAGSSLQLKGGRPVISYFANINGQDSVAIATCLAPCDINSPSWAIDVAGPSGLAIYTPLAYTSLQLHGGLVVLSHNTSTGGLRFVACVPNCGETTVLEAGAAVVNNSSLQLAGRTPILAYGALTSSPSVQSLRFLYASSQLLPIVVPAPPTIYEVVPGIGQATLTYAASASDGGVPISEYSIVCSAVNGTTVQLTIPGGDPLSSVHTVTLNGFINNRQYTCSMQANNQAGLSPWSAASKVFTPGGTAPGYPSSIGASAGDGSITVTFGLPASDGGLPIEEYLVTCTPQNGAGEVLTFSALQSPVTFNGASNGVTHVCEVRAVNSAGTGFPATSQPVTPVRPIVPGKPTGVTATAGPGLIYVYFTPPGPNGGPAISSYTATCGPESRSISANSSGPIIVDLLVAGRTYDCTVYATNIIGNGPASDRATAIPLQETVPAKVSKPFAFPGNGQITVQFLAPSNNGGRKISSYLARCGSASAFLYNPPEPSQYPYNIVVTGLTNGVDYTCTVTATNSVGSGQPSDPSNIARPRPPAAPPAPTINFVYSIPGSSANITVSISGLDGGSPILEFAAICVAQDGSGRQGVASGSSSSIVVSGSGIVGGVTYKCTATVRNGIGTSPPSDASNPITPISVPAAPTIGVAMAGQASIRVAFTAPGSNGGAAITGYLAVCASRDGSAPTVTQAGDLPAIIVAGLTNGVEYKCNVSASNQYGPGASSADSNFATPAAPVAGAVDAAGNVGQYASLQFNNGSPVISYYDVTNGDLKLASCSANCGDAANWVIVSVDTAGDVGRHSMLRLNNGNPVISYYDATNQQLKLATCRSGCQGTTPDWAITVVESGNVGMYSALQLLPGGNPVVSYYDAGANGLRVATCTANCQSDTPSWVQVAADALGGRYTSLQLNGTRPVVSHHDPQSGQIRVSTCMANCQAANAQWVSQPVSGGAVSGTHTALQLNGGMPVIAYFDTSDNSYHLATCTDRCESTNATWTNVVIDAQTEAPASQRQIALQLNGSNPIVTYYNSTSTTSGALRLGICKSTCATTPAWDLSTADGSGNVGAFNALQLIGINPATAYYDGAAGDLKYQTMVSPHLGQPGAPVISSVTAGNGQAVVNFTAPVSNGGAAITGYSATCGAQTRSGADNATSIAVTGLANGATYSCTVKAINSAGAGTASSSVDVALPSSPTLSLTAVKSRKTH